MVRAATSLEIQPAMSLIDGLPIKGFPYPYCAVVKGDSLSMSIAAASILAKVHRDRIMMEYAKTYPATEFTLIRRTAPKVKVGFATIIMPSFYVDEYFGSIPARMEAICYINTGTHDEMQNEFRDWLADRQE